jgi:hypothetical protein
MEAAVAYTGHAAGTTPVTRRLVFTADLFRAVFTVFTLRSSDLNRISLELRNGLVHLLLIEKARENPAPTVLGSRNSFHGLRFPKVAIPLFGAYNAPAGFSQSGASSRGAHEFPKKADSFPAGDVFGPRPDWAQQKPFTQEQFSKRSWKVPPLEFSTDRRFPRPFHP